MSHTKSARFLKAKAEVVLKITNPCVFCGQILDDEISYGKQYSIGNIECHYFCVLLSCCLIQKGKDSDGLFGFMYQDIVNEVERSKKHKCSYCGKEGATLGCSVGHCRKQFHLPCGRQKDAVSLFYGNYKSFCQNHLPKQKISEEVMSKARIRQKNNRLSIEKSHKIQASDASNNVAVGVEAVEAESVCVVCYEQVEGFPTPRTFWPPCCARDAWFHRRCIERMALNAGMHYLKCPLCNDKERFYEEVVDQGYYVPDRDAAWELEVGAYSEMGAARRCSAAECRCPQGPEHDAEQGLWDLAACVLCGSVARHAGCASPSPLSDPASPPAAMLCGVCQQTNPTSELLAQIAKVPLTPERSRPAELGPVMPSRMSLRRTKRRPAAASTSSTPCPIKESRLELNLKSPRKPERVQETREVAEKNVLYDVNNKLVSPLKLFEITFTEKINSLGVSDDVKIDSKSVLEKVRKKLNKPKPLSKKKKIVNDILEGLISDLMKENTKAKSPIKNWTSPVKMSNGSNALDKPNIKSCTKVILAGGVTPEKTRTKNVDYNKLDSEDHEQNEELEKCDEKEGFKGFSVDDEDTNSTFQLSPEFIAENDSDDSLPFINTPKKLKMVDIRDNSAMEISIDHGVNVNLVKMAENDAKTVTDFIKDVVFKSPERNKKCAFKFSPIDKETLQKSNVGIDLEIFKNQYLNEVDKEFMCTSSNANSPNGNRLAMEPAKDAKDVKRLSLKRKISVRLQKDKKHIKKPRKSVKNTKALQKKAKISKVNKKGVKSYTKLKIKLKSRKKKVKKSQECRVDSINLRQKDRKLKNNLKNRKKILKIKKNNDKALSETKTLKQTVLTFGSPQKTPQIADSTPKIRKKKVKLEKSPDGLKQTSLQNFFKKTVV